LPAPRQRVADLPPEARVPGHRRLVGKQLAVKPGGAFGADLPIERQDRQSPPDRARSCLHPLIGCRAVEMVGSDDPGAVRLALDARAGAAPGFEPAHMRLREGGVGGPVMLEVDIDAVAAAMGDGDFHHGVVGLGSVGFASRAMIPPAAGGSASTPPIST
jgi:hypothetical protein